MKVPRGAEHPGTAPAVSATSVPVLPWVPWAGIKGQQNIRGFAILPPPSADSPKPLGLAMKRCFNYTRAELDGERGSPGQLSCL